MQKDILSRINKSDYRPDIDGLRAIAVLSVLLHHINPSLLPGGFIGVDIFFVISGYLISSHIYKEACEKTFTIKRFYKRRINRIIPALVTVLVITLIVGTIVLSPSDLIRLAKSTEFSLLGVSNIFFWREYGNYFSRNSGEAPLLHTWSLGVEEQFYVIWPFFILLLLKLNRLFIIGVLTVFTIGAVILSEMATGIFMSASYYLLPTRFFELMIGGLLALIMVHRSLESRIYSELCFGIGILLIGGSLFWLNKSSYFPGINALWPCLGAALIILAGDSQYKTSYILTNRPIVFIGLISYSLYLWHWPIIAYLNYMNILISPLIGAAIVTTATVLAWLSWKYVELPMRQSGLALSFSRVFAQRFVIPVTILLSLGAAIIYNKGYPQRFDPRVAEFEKVLTAKPDILRSGCHVQTALYNTPPNISKCRLGANKPEPDGILIGDSLANHFTGMLDVLAKANNLTLMDFTMDGCPPILGYKIGKNPTYVEKCLSRNETAYALIATKHFRRVILGGVWPKEPALGQQVMASIAYILNTGATVTVIIQNPVIERADSCMIRGIMYKSSKNCTVALQEPPEYFKEIAAKYPTVKFIDPSQVICNKQKCSPVINNTLLYRDETHLNDAGSRLIGYSLLNMGVKLQ
jgi:peptidoglycan/LPS O-acetylase OafA/YrhL